MTAPVPTEPAPRTATQALADEWLQYAKDAAELGLPAPLMTWAAAAQRVLAAIAADEARADTNGATAALAELVALKDGPRDADYERRKPLAWQAARDALAAASPSSDAGAGTAAETALTCDHPGLDHDARWSYCAQCPQCGVCKFIGHGPLCGDCYTTPAAVVRDRRAEQEETP